MKKDKKHILPDADLLSAMESLKVYGGKGNPLDPQDTNSDCTYQKLRLYIETKFSYYVRGLTATKH